MFGKKITKGANAVVTGAGSGIGRAFALEIVRRGGRVVCADISLERAQETVEMIMDQVAGKLKNADLDALRRTKNSRIENQERTIAELQHSPPTRCGHAFLPFLAAFY